VVEGRRRFGDGVGESVQFVELKHAPSDRRRWHRYLFSTRRTPPSASTSAAGPSTLANRNVILRPGVRGVPGHRRRDPVGQRLLLVVAVQVARRRHERRVGPAPHQHPAFFLSHGLDDWRSSGPSSSPDMRSATAIITSTRSRRRRRWRRRNRPAGRRRARSRRERTG